MNIAVIEDDERSETKVDLVDISPESDPPRPRFSSSYFVPDFSQMIRLVHECAVILTSRRSARDALFSWAKPEASATIVMSHCLSFAIRSYLIR